MAERDLARIAFVSRRFAELQGLRTAALGALLMLVVISTTLLPADFRDPFAQLLWTMVVWFCLSFTVLDQYYNRTFGRVPLIPWRRFARLYTVPEFPAGGWSESIPSGRPLGRPVSIGSLVLYGALLLEASKSALHAGGLSITAAALFGYSLFVLLRDWKHRPHYLLGLGAATIGIVITWRTPIASGLGRDLPASIGSPYLQAYAILALGLLAIGLLDHQLLWRAMARDDDRRCHPPDPALSRLRVVFSVTVFAVIAAHIATAGWPEDALVLHVLLSVALMFVLIGTFMLQTWRDAGVTAAARARARAERLEASVAALSGNAPQPAEDPPVVTDPPPHFDAVGHLLLPLAIACGAVADLTLVGGGIPSLLASALAASHLRIAWRDWPSRGHYLLGAVAASASAVHFAFVSGETTLNWVVWFLLLISAASCVEGARDLTLSKRLLPTPGDDHVHTV